MKRLSLIFFFFLFPLLLIANEWIEVSGNLDRSAVDQLLEEVDQFKSSPLVMVLDSEEGDFEAALALARRIAHWKEQSKGTVIAYLDENVVGPAALLPFVADEIYASRFVTWGDLDAREKSPAVLRSTLRGLVDGDLKQSLLLAMALGDEVVMDQKQMTQEKGSRLVLNQKQLKKLGLLVETLPREKFEEKFSISSVPAPTKSAALPTEKGSFEEELRKHIRYSDTEENIVGHLYIGDKKTQITEGTWLYVKQALDEYRKLNPIFIILELDTPGGQVYAAQKISDALQELDTQLDIPVVCYINNWAISAGVMLTYSCRFITVEGDASLGAAEPLLQTGQGTQVASEKINSALRADFANRANYFGRNTLLPQAMVDKDMILVLRDGEFVNLSDEKQLRLKGSRPDLVVSPKGKLLTLNAKEIMEFGVGDLLVEPMKIASKSAKEEREGKWSSDKEPLFQKPFFNSIPNVKIVSYQPDWKTQFFTFLAKPAVASVLLMGLILGFYMEMNTPGFGIAGGFALFCLCMILLSSFAMEAIQWFEVILFFAGIALVVIDLLVIPTFGILGVVGVAMAIFGLMAIMLPGLENVDYEFDTNTFNAAGEYVLMRLGWLSMGFVISVIGIFLLAKYVFPALAPYSRLVLTGHEQEGFVAGVPLEDLPPLGSEGVTETNLKPAGTILVEGKLFDALSDGSYINKGEKVTVVEYEGSVLIVEKKENS